MPSCLDLTNRVAVVIGATSGLGRAIAIGLAEHGADVVPTGRRRNNIEEVCRFDFAADFFDVVTPPAGGHYIGAMFGEPDGNGAAESRGSADHHGYAISQIQATWHVSRESLRDGSPSGPPSGRSE